MSAMRATGMKSRDRCCGRSAWSAAAPPAAACRCSRRRPAQRRSRRPAARSGRASRPAPRAIQTGCSPCSARCSDIEQVTRVRRPAMRRASAVISSAGRPQIAAAQAASFGWPSSRPEEVALETAPSRRNTGRESRGRAAPRRPACAPGRASARHRCRGGSGARRPRPRPAGRRGSGRSGGTRRRAGAPRRAVPRAICSLVPPPPTSLFFSAMPPNASTSALSATSSSQLTLLPATKPCGPMTCGRITLAAPEL